MPALPTAALARITDEIGTATDLVARRADQHGHAALGIPVLRELPAAKDLASRTSRVQEWLARAEGQFVTRGDVQDVGSYLVAYLTGQGLVNPPGKTGAAAPLIPLSRPVVPITASIGGLDARVSWAGLAPSYLGLFQVNIQVPEIIPGDSGLIITVGGAASSPIPVAVAKD